MKTLSSIRLISALMISCVVAGCAAHTALEPVGKGNLDMNAGLGGPIVAAFGTHIPIPYLTVGANYGVDDRIDISGNLHLLSLAYSLAGVDAGGTWYPVINDGPVPTLALGARLTAFASLKRDIDERFRIVPTLTSTAAWRLGPGLIFTGLDLTIPLTRQTYDTAAVAVILSPAIGYRWNLGARTRLYTELRWQAVNVRSDQLAAEYSHPGGYGAIAPFVAFEWELR
ncbi:MAG: hypothetical protein ABIR47_00425 [Candidatus Kapaibacterium sp.]